MQVKSWFTVLLLAASAAAQELPANPALQQAIAVDDLEHDPARAKPLYAAIAADASAADAVRRHAALRLARVLRRLGEDASAALAQAEQGDDAVAKAAKLLRAELAEDPARQAELAKRAEAAVAAWVNGSATQYTDVAWFGDAAIRAVKGGLLEWQEKWLDTDRRRRALFLVWAIGGDAARTFARSVLAGDDLPLRRLFASALSLPRGGGTPLKLDLEVLRLALRDSDEDVVADCLAIATSMTNWGLTRVDVQPLVHDSRDRVRRAARECLVAVMRRVAVAPETAWPADSPELLAALQRHAGLRDRRAAILAAESEAITAELPKMLTATDPVEYRAACSLLLEWAPRSVSGRRVLVSVLPQLRLAGLNRARLPLFPGDGQPLRADENVDSLGAALRQLGARRPGPEFDVGNELLGASLGCWGPKALESVLLAIRLGYQSDLPHGVLHWLGRHATAADVPLVMSRLDSGESLALVAPWLAQHDLPSAAFEPLRAAYAERSNDSLLEALARTDHAGVAALLRDIARPPTEPRQLAQSIDLLMKHARVRPDAATRDALRTQLEAVWDRRSGIDSVLSSAHHAVAALVRLGDSTWLDKPMAELAALFTIQGQPQYVGLQNVPASAVWEKDYSTTSFYDLLAAARVVDGRVHWWHGYAPEVVAAFWRRAIDKDTSDEVWRGLSRSLGGFVASKDAERAPLLMILTRLGEVVATAVLQSPQGIGAKPPLCNLLASIWDTRREDRLTSTEAAAADALHRAALTASAPEVRAVAVAALQVDGQADRAAIERALADDDHRVGHAALNLFAFAGQSLPRDLLIRALRSPAQETRRQAVALLRNRTDDVADLWRGLLTDTDSEIRITACQTLAKSLRLDAVPPLLEALKDADQRVREAATASLQAIRFYHDEQSHWQRVFDGRAGLTAASAAEALLAQAKPGNDKDTRLLAIRSLGALGAAETQPFLIGWTKDADAEIAAAAREAVGRIHTKK